MKVTEVIKRFLEHYTHPDLAALYHPGMEVQINVRPDGGTPTESKAYTNGQYDWFNIRIPKHARTTPEFRDFDLKYPLTEHALAIGMTGWDFVEKRSRWVAFDFDKLTATSHQSSGIEETELERVKDAACSIPWVEVRRSTGGAGLHLYVYLDVPTANHTEHAALGRAVLHLMCAQAGYNFASSVDVCGGNMWVWHRKMTADNQGLTLVKRRECDLTTIPTNWRDHINVVSNKGARVKLPGIPDEREGELAANKVCELDDTHRKLIEWLGENGWTSVWEADFGMLRTHTKGLQDASDALQLRGTFQTNSTGSDKADYNCFCFPRHNGAWRVVRYGEGTPEASTWTQDGKGWTFCYLNQWLDLPTASAVAGGADLGNGKFSFYAVTDAREAVRLMGGAMPEITEREVTLQESDSGVIIETSRLQAAERIAGWGVVGKKLRYAVKITKDLAADKGSKFDDVVRHLATPDGSESGWAFKQENGGWEFCSQTTAQNVLMGTLAASSSDAKAMLGTIARNGYTLVSEPFQPEFLSGRRWNRNSAKLAFEPIADDDATHDHWDSILAHCGEGLDSAVAADPWCKQHGILTGADYLRLWAARLLRHPTQHLPYLFFYSECNNSGKSSFHKALALLLARGYELANNSITERFNKQLASAVLCAVEEVDLSADPEAYNRIKYLTSEDFISLRGMRSDAITVRNTTHWIQTGNKVRNCPVESTDERIVAIEVQPVSRSVEIPWYELRDSLRKEAPAFLRTLFDLEIPDYRGRLGMPLLTTDLLRSMKGETNKVDLIEALAWFAEMGWVYKIGAGRLLKNLGPFVPDPPKTVTNLVEVLSRTDWPNGIKHERGKNSSIWHTLVNEKGRMRRELAERLVRECVREED